MKGHDIPKRHKKEKENWFKNIEKFNEILKKKEKAFPDLSESDFTKAELKIVDKAGYRNSLIINTWANQQKNKKNNKIWRDER